MTDNDRTAELMLKHHNAMFDLIDELFVSATTPKLPVETWLIRQLKTMRVYAQLSGLDHEADVLTQAINELGGVL